MFGYMNSLLAALVVLPVLAAVSAAWRRDVAPTSGAAIRTRAHVPATGAFVVAVDGYATKFGPQSRGSSW
ncbi:MAG: hypothetical protein AB7O74_12590 [Candidatus Nanopelagicales bacterium]|jgi:hypothetical protein